MGPHRSFLAKVLPLLILPSVLAGRIYGSVNRLQFRSSRDHDLVIEPHNAILNEDGRRFLDENDNGRPANLPPLSGDPSCPCLSVDEAGDVTLDDTTEAGRAALSVISNITSYGIGCRQHDLQTPDCLDGITDEQPFFCQQRFCYVDPNNCDLLTQRSVYFQARKLRFLSYATCYDADGYSALSRIQKLENTTLRLGLVTNSGGWAGAYHKDGEHYVGPLADWHGPTVEFLRKAAVHAKFSMEIIQPPRILHDKSTNFFHDGQDNAFNACVYAVAMGWLDLCGSKVFLTNERSSVTPFFVVQDVAIALVVPQQKAPSPLSTDGLKESIGIVFAPLDGPVWILLIFFVFPVLGVLVLCHERTGNNPSYPRFYPRREDESEEDYLARVGTDSDGNPRRVPLWRHMVKSIYALVLSVFQEEYDESAYSTGGWIHLLGVGALTLGLIEVYTANLAAILTNEADAEGIHTVEGARRAGYRFCADRRPMELVLSLDRSLEEEMFVKDPEDGLPGFMASRHLKFDRMNEEEAQSSSEYCHVALSILEDLDAEQAEGRHCDKVAIHDDSLGHIASGYPVSEDMAPSITALFHQLQNEGGLSQILTTMKPRNQCEAYQEQVQAEDTTSLSIHELNGIWVVCGMFALAGLATTCWMRLIAIRRRRNRLPEAPVMRRRRLSD